MNISARNLSVPAINPAELSVISGQVTTTSLHVAEHFGKLHKDVLKRINSLDCSADFRERNFAPTIQEVPGPNGALRKEPAFRMTRDGFTFLCMGFTGKQAAKWKEAYINAFNQMEAQLQPVALALPQPPQRVLVVFGANGQVKSHPVPADACMLRASELPAWVADPTFFGDAEVAAVADAALRRLLASCGEKAVRQVLVEIDNNWMLVNEHRLRNVHNELSFMLMHHVWPKRVTD